MCKHLLTRWAGGQVNRQQAASGRLLHRQLNPTGVLERSGAVGKPAWQRLPTTGNLPHHGMMPSNHTWWDQQLCEQTNQGPNLVNR